MNNVVRFRLSAVFVAVGVFAFALAACGGRVTPSNPPQNANPNVSIGAQRPQSEATVARGCPPPFGTLPGTYVQIVDNGNVKNGTFVPILSHSFWERATFVATAVGTPNPGPTPPLKHPPMYIYRGTYRDVHKGVVDSIGCAVLLTSQSGQIITQFKANAADVESPTFTKPIRVLTIHGVGTVTKLTIANLTALGGHGSYTLSDGSTGTMTFTLRQSIP